MTPPSPSDHPGAVFVSDYGRHARLALQLDDQWLIEYAFGDWDYYAMEQRNPWRGAVALLVPTQSTLARRFLPLTTDEDRFNAMAGPRRTARLWVEREALAELVARLDQSYRQQLPTETHLPDLGLTFVQHDRRYHLLHNSNHRVAAWLRALGCEVEGSPLLSNFEVNRDATAPPLPRPPTNP